MKFATCFIQKILCFELGFVFFICGIAGAEVPYQFIAKQYSEALGRIPDQGGWQARVGYYAGNGCNQTTLKYDGRGFYLGSDYGGRGYSSNERVFSLYRGILSREPDDAGFWYWVNYLNSGGSWESVVDAFFNSYEFGQMVASVCSGQAYRSDWGGLRPFAIGGSRSQATLQSQLYAGGTVVLNPQEVIYISSSLIIPSGATLVTSSAPERYHIARFGRLIRDSSFSGPMVVIYPGGTLDRVWVDGQKWRFTSDIDRTNVVLEGGGVITRSRSGDSLGWSHIVAGDGNGPATVTDNLITGYSTIHKGIAGYPSDGLSITCRNSYVVGNHIVDVTDVGIVLFRSLWGPQNSFIAWNTILQAGRSAFAAIAIDHLDAYASFYGSSVYNNLMWTSGTQHFDIGISAGTKPWNQPGLGWYLNVTANTTGSLTARLKNGIVIDGALSSTIINNGLSTINVNTGNTCPSNGAVSADVSGGHASGTLQPYTDMAVHNCVPHE